MNQKVTTVKVGETLELTATWSGILGVLVMLLESGKHESRQVAIEELKKMARAADLYNERKGN